MGNGRSLRRGLQKRNVYLAEKTGRVKHELAMQMVAERVKTDAEFAKDVLKVTGGILRPDIKKDAEATISASLIPEELKNSKVEVLEHELHTGSMVATNLLVGGDRTHELVPEQTDGGGMRLVHPTELPDYPRDGEIRFTSKPVEGTLDMDKLKYK